jgi:quinol monooxygenase YgiN
MSKAPVHLVVQLTIHDGQFDAFQTIAQEMIAGTQPEVGTLGYEWFISRDRKRCRLLETYANPDALLAHFQGPVVQQLVPQLAQHVSIEAFEVYGDPGPEAIAMLAGFGAQILYYWGGLGRAAAGGR